MTPDKQTSKSRDKKKEKSYKGKIWVKKHGEDNYEEKNKRWKILILGVKKRREENHTKTEEIDTRRRVRNGKYMI